MVTDSFGLESTSKGLKFMDFTSAQYENETHRLEKAQRMAVNTTKYLRNVHCSERFEELDLFSLSKKRLRDCFNTICKYLYRNKNLVMESSL